LTNFLPTVNYNICVFLHSIYISYISSKFNRLNIAHMKMKSNLIEFHPTVIRKKKFRIT
jgi:hypothetical protein